MSECVDLELTREGLKAEVEFLKAERNAARRAESEMEQQRDEARKLAREYYEFVQSRWRGYAATLRERFPWLMENDDE